MSEFVKWPHIEKLYNVQKHAQKLGKTGSAYRAKVKLHGTNAAVRVSPEGVIEPQSRNRTLTPEDDNHGFAKWATAQSWPTYTNSYVVFGEWVGQGVQTGVALSQLEDKHFVIFAMLWSADGNLEAGYEYNPERLSGLFPGHRVMPWYGPVMYFDFQSENTGPVSWLNAAVEGIDKLCPWTKSEFGIEGVGEGLVCYPLDLPLEGFMFKVKGASHAEGGAAPAKAKPPVSADVVAFAESVATEARFLQFLPAEVTMKNIGPFLGAVCKDIQREAADEMAASGLEWKVVNPSVVKVAREWYMKRAV